MAEENERKEGRVEASKNHRLLSLQDRAPAFTVEDVRQAEAALGVSIPAEYLQFIEDQNGGFPSVPVEFEVPQLEDRAALHGVYGIRSDPLYGLVPNNLDVEGLMWAGYLLVGFDDYNSNVCIDVRAGQAPRVFYWDWHTRDEGLEASLHRIAESWTEFLDSLRAAN